LKILKKEKKRFKEKIKKEKKRYVTRIRGALRRVFSEYGVEQNCFARIAKDISSTRLKILHLDRKWNGLACLQLTERLQGGS